MYGSPVLRSTLGTVAPLYQTTSTVLSSVLSVDGTITASAEKDSLFIAGLLTGRGFYCTYLRVVDSQLRSFCSADNSAMKSSALCFATPFGLGFCCVGVPV